jgi:uncharacterized protein
MGHSVVMVKEALAPHARYLVDAGLVVLAVDWPTVGASERRPRGQWWPERQVEDLRVGVSYLRTRPEVDAERIGRWGHSTAAGVAIVAGAIDRRVGAVAGQNPSLLDAWAALERSRGRAAMAATQGLMEQDAQRRFETGQGATMPALPTQDPQLAGYVAQAERLFPTFRNQVTLESLEHVLVWAPIQLIRRLAPTPLLLVTGVDDQVHAIDDVLEAYERAREPKRLELLQVDEFGLSIEPGLGRATGLAAELLDQQLRPGTPVRALAGPRGSRGSRPAPRVPDDRRRPVRPVSAGRGSSRPGSSGWPCSG